VKIEVNPENRTSCGDARDAKVTQTFPVMDAKGSWFVEHFNHAFPFYVYAAFCVVLLIVVSCLVPETKGRSLEQIERSWARKPEHIK
jgi:SP family xylose:H+ symportor-like MFS transporter